MHMVTPIADDNMGSVKEVTALHQLSCTYSYAIDNSTNTHNHGTEKATAMCSRLGGKLEVVELEKRPLIRGTVGAGVI